MFRNRYKLIVSIIIIILLLLGNVYAVPYIRLIINGQQVYTDVPPQIVNGTTLVPIRVISETLGAKVNWDGNTQTVTVDMPQYTPEAKMVEHYWETTNDNTGNITPPAIDSSVSGTLNSYLKDAYTLLKQKAPEAYKLVCAYISKVSEAETTTDSNVFATTYSNTHTIVFNTPALKMFNNNPYFYNVECIAITLAHEAYHGQQMASGSFEPNNVNCNEATAYTYEYFVAKQLGVPQDLLNWIKTQITNNLN
ncbi:copper amine oxidase domain protein [Thermoanaerobacterium thermosaccharolyticum DSM 571]|uniref:Copper amine oxidase domain protein n=1 Tax=Thermoanaerobacterium thermosaccharolyticum (strain ATCC 7956 / DSM 571 / NCIMB 9385 / NCA 3814 / NCTC 13789 / WDCM 00135 / 2032) TaxID=580327 RepID=D9TPB9_THETC|nr:copper amine oxidase N-terminal domain-containing protein [Thermoanaerobacterium thermosaccharolyticum]ADL70142.1 copper amine oxidase domain protein [Thermoanaerobacterium thermosaccharolyticum DSM 571]